MNNAKMTGLFPTPVWSRQLAPETADPLNSELLALVARLQGNAGSDTGAQWQSQQHLHRLPECTGLSDQVISFADDVCDELTIVRESITVSACWANVVATGGSVRSHYHPNNYLSGSYYLQVDETNGAIEFNDPRAQSGIIVPPARDRDRANRDRDSISVRDGLLLIHPSWLMHAVPANRSKLPRISISFNLMFPDFGTRMTSPLWEGDAGMEGLSSDD